MLEAMSGTRDFVSAQGIDARADEKERLGWRRKRNLGPASRPNPPKRTTVGWVAAGRSRRCGTLWRVSLAIAPTVCQQHSAADDDHGEQGQHVHRHASERLGLRRFWPDGGWNDENSSRYRRISRPAEGRFEPRTLASRWATVDPSTGRLWATAAMVSLTMPTARTLGRTVHSAGLVGPLPWPGDRDLVTTRDTF